VLGELLDICSIKPMTGFYRDGCCNTGREDVGSHTICAIMTSVVVTGGTSGIGEVAAEALARMGADGQVGLVACVRRATCADFYHIDALTVRTSDVRDHVPLTH
jgi:uncharacterized protein (DUF2237 family)